MKSELHAGCLSRDPLGQGLDGGLKKWLGLSGSQSTERNAPHSAHEWVEPVITKTASMAFLLPEVYKFFKQRADLLGHHQSILDVQHIFDLTS